MSYLFLALGDFLFEGTSGQRSRSGHLGRSLLRAQPFLHDVRGLVAVIFLAGRVRRRVAQKIPPASRALLDSIGYLYRDLDVRPSRLAHDASHTH